MTAAGNEVPAVVLGAGSAGLTAALSLARAGRRVVVVEKEPHLGGLASTIQHGPYRLDFGPHAFHCKRDEAEKLFRELCPDGCRDIAMRASLLFHRKYFEYPLKFGQAMMRLEPSFTARMLLDYCAALARRLVSRVPEDSFEAWGVKRYGRTMYDMAFGNYSRKVWGMPTSMLHWKLARQKLPDMNMLELIRETLGSKGAKQKILYSAYAYPYHGIGTVFDAMGEEIRRRGGQILLETEPRTIFFRGARAVAVGVAGAGMSRRIPCSLIITTVPLREFAGCGDIRPNDALAEASNRLIYRHLMLAYLEVSQKNVTNEYMVYLLDPDFTFNRIGEQKNIAPEMIPVDRTMLCFEICADEKGRWWHMSDRDFMAVARRDLLKLGTVRREDILDGFVKRVRQAYPIYDLQFDRNLSIVLDWIESLENVYPIGRQGLFLNSDVHTSMKMGLEVARHCIRDEPRQKWIAVMRRHLDWQLK